MNAELYVQKAILQLGRGQGEQAVESLKLAIETAGNDMIIVAQAHCILGEHFFISQRYIEANVHLMWISDHSEELENNYDDLLNEEINRAIVLLDLMERFSLNGW